MELGNHNKGFKEFEEFRNELSELRLKLTEFLPRLGKKLLELRSQSLVVQRKSDGSKVCAGDYLSDELLTEFLKKHSAFPVISEEQELPGLFLNDPTWVIDPIDGTSHYINNGEDFAIMLALVVNKEPVFSMVYLPTKELGYGAELGKGAYRYHDRDMVETKLLINSANSDGEERYFQLSGLKFYEEEYKWFLSQGIEKYKITGGIGVKLCKIAEGSAHYYLNLNRPLKIWDIMPTTLIIKEAGGWISDARGGKLLYDKSGYFITNGLFIAPDNNLVKHLASHSGYLHHLQSD